MFATLMLLIAASAPPPPQPKPFSMSIDLPFARDAEVWIELPAPEVGDRFKKLSVEQFRRHAKYIVYAEYELKHIKVDGMEIRELRFYLPVPKSQGQHVVSAKPQRMELPANFLRYGARCKR
jgi:hypothetical protein